MSNPIEDIKHHDSVLENFSEAAYQHMASKKFGIKFCCEKDLTKLTIDKELLRLNAMMDKELTPIICLD